MRVVKTMLWTVTVSLTLVAAGASEKAPAEQALKTAEAAIGAIRGEAAKWVPDQAQSLEASLTSLKDELGKGDYKVVLAEASALAGRPKEVAAAAAAKKLPANVSKEKFALGMPVPAAARS